MGRIRCVKPELIQQPWFGTLTDAAARTFYGLLGVVDDFGRCAAGPAFIAGQIFWGAQRSANAIGRQLAELERAGIIRRYAARGGEYLEILGWFDKGGPLYQQINKPQGERFPAPISSTQGERFPQPDADYDRPTTGPRDRPTTGPDPIRSESELEREGDREGESEAGRSRGPSPVAALAQSEPPAQSPKRTRAERSISIPVEWAPRSDELALARELGVDPAKEHASFRDHHTAKGSRFVDWNAAFRTWLRNAVKFNRGGSARGSSGSASFFAILDSLPPREVAP
jgi:hypothetical protein